MSLLVGSNTKNSNETMLDKKSCSSSQKILDDFFNKSREHFSLQEDSKKLLELVEEIQQKCKIIKHNFHSEDVKSEKYSSEFFENFDTDNELCNDEDYDCSVFKRLTRKCFCMNHTDYNDFVIHFNENIKHFTNDIGEIIKNIRIVKKFLYIGGDYSKNSLLFLNEGLTFSSHSEIVKIIQGCANSDICNLFEGPSFVQLFMSTNPNSNCKKYNTEKSLFQMNTLAANLIHKLVQYEEGRAYLNLNSKVLSDIKKVLKPKKNLPNPEFVEICNSILETMNNYVQHQNKRYQVQDQTGLSKRIIRSLSKNTKLMTDDEILEQLKFLFKMTMQKSGLLELTNNLPELLCLFKHMIVEFDNSNLNIIILNIIHKIVYENSKHPTSQELVKHIEGTENKCFISN